MGTGGASHYALNKVLPNSEAHNTDAYGVLSMTLRPDGYDWQSVPEDGRSFGDSGSASGHCAPTPAQASLDSTAAESPAAAGADADASAAASGSQIEWWWGLLADSVVVAAVGAALSVGARRRHRSD